METKEDNFPAQWALDLLEPEPTDYTGIVRRYYLVPAVAAIGVGGLIFKAKYYKYPFRHDLAKNVRVIAYAVTAGFVMNYVSNLWHARRDAVIIDYVMKHPERFPPPENRKFADIFEPWIPVR